MEVASASGWAARQGVADRSADWKRVLEGGEYPYATFPLTQLAFEMPGPAAGQTACLATLLAGSRTAGAAYRVREPRAGVVRVEGPHGQPAGLRVEDGDLSVRADGQALEVRYAPTPEVPDALRSRLAKA
jgi:hypothetical protein